MLSQGTYRKLALQLLLKQPAKHFAQRVRLGGHGEVIVGNGVEARKVSLVGRRVLVARERHLATARLVGEEFGAVGEGGTPHVLVDEMEELVRGDGGGGPEDGLDMAGGRDQVDLDPGREVPADDVFGSPGKVVSVGVLMAHALGDAEMGGRWAHTLSV